MVKAADSGNLAGVKSAFKKYSSSKDPEVKDRSLIWASENGHLDVVEYLVSQGANVRTRFVVEQTPLHLTSKNGHTDVARFLLDHGAKVDDLDSLNKSALHDAASMGRADVVKLLIDRGANVRLKSSLDDSMPIHEAAEANSIPTVEYLLKHGANPNDITKKKCTPLHIALTNGNLDVARYLIENGAKVTMFCEEHGQAIHLASKRKGNLDMVKLLVKHGSKITAKDTEGYLPIHLAASHDVEMVKWLIEQGSPVDTPSSVMTREDFHSMPSFWEEKWGAYTPLHEGANHAEICKLLLKNGASVNARDANGNTPIFYSGMEDGAADYLIKHGANPKAVNHFKYTWLHWECEIAQEPKDVRYILDQNVNPNAVNSFGDQALHMVCASRHFEIVKLLVEHGAGINARDSDGETPLALAVQKNSPYLDRDNADLVDYLIKNGADIHATNGRGDSIVALCESEVILKKILKLGANPNIANKDGDTPLHNAAQYGNLDKVKLLIKNGANPEAKNHFGNTPADIALSWGKGEQYQKIRDYILSQKNKR